VPVAAKVTYETVIGLEVHAQVLTKSKMYCGCSADYANADPNTFVCPVCLGLPGALPVMNRAAIESVIRTGLALECEIPAACKLDRKNYVYPDLPKGYQISQYDLPLCVNGVLDFMSGGETVRAGITRVHIEEDTGRLVHRTAADGSEASLVDLNRSGVPLMEIVGEPDLRSPEQARDYLVALRQILRYIGASSGNMEDGAFRCDANVSLRPSGSPELGAKVEIKNMNSFRSVERALRFEVERQAAMLDAGERIGQETRGWVEARAVTVPQRTKEQAHDYRYFPEPDLPPLTITASETERLRTTLPELPVARRRRFETDFELSPTDATLLTLERAVAGYFESALGTDLTPDRAKTTANWILNDLLSLQKDRGLPADALPVTAVQLSALISMVRDGELSQRAAKELLPGIARDESPRQAAERLNLLSLSDDSVLRTAVAETLLAFPEAVADYRRGKTAAMGRLIGETIKRTGGRAKPDTVRGLLVEALTAE
jgi:aspartyl-tRNA(Asn)/glutamyl-tRNA(Gln) amidotransferase subunit B